MSSDMLRFKYNGIAEWKSGGLSQAESTECIKAGRTWCIIETQSSKAREYWVRGKIKR